MMIRPITGLDVDTLLLTFIYLSHSLPLMAEAPHFDGNLNLDLGNLAAFDLNPVTESQLDAVASTNAAALLKALAKLPHEGTFLTLPAPTLILPRAKALPKVKPMTKWEKFRKANGLGRRRKRSRMVFEPLVDDYVPRWGPYSAKHVQDKMNIAKPEKNGMDQFEAESLEKQQKSARTRVKQVHNEMHAKVALKETLEIAQRSTASRGKYDRSSDEPKAKKTYTRKPMQASNASLERQKSLEILEEIGRKKRKTLSA